MERHTCTYSDTILKSGGVSVLFWVIMIGWGIFTLISVGGYLVQLDRVKSNRFPAPVQAPVDPKEIEERAEKRAENLQQLQAVIQEAGSFERQDNFAVGEEKYFFYPFRWKHCQGPVLGPGLWHVTIYKWLPDKSLSFDKAKGPADGEAEVYTDFTLDTVVKDDDGRQIRVPGGFSEPDSLFFYYLANKAPGPSWVSVPAKCQ